jgi:mono/diheme cytochrome c family protein
MKNSKLLTGGIVFALALGAITALASTTEGFVLPDDVRSLFGQKCAVCHKGKYPPQGLNLEPANVPASLDTPSRQAPSLKIIDTKDPEASYLLKKVRREKGITGKPMPPGKALTEGELQVLRAWIESLGQRPYQQGPLPSPGRSQGPSWEPVPALPVPPDEAAPERPFDKPAFWGTRLINLPTTTPIEKKDFLLRISHRFLEPADSGFDDLFGLDGYANVLVSFGYGLTDNLSVTVGRARLYKEFEFGADWLIAGQGYTARFPFSVALHGGLSLATEADDNIKLFAALNLSRQFTRRFSVMVVPAFSTNTNHFDADPDGTFALGLGTRYMIFEDLSVIAEWTPALAGYKDVESGWGLGLEKKIGGHVFQFFVTNALGLTIPQVLPGGDLRLGDFDFRIGFNIFRTF